MSSSRQDEFLFEVRSALRGLIATSASRPRIVSQQIHVDELVAQFSRELKQVDGHFYVAINETAIKDYLSTVIARRNVEIVAISDAPILGQLNLHEWLRTRGQRVISVGSAGRSLQHGTDTHDVIAKADLGITSCRFAVAETGTLVLASNDEENGLISLLPLIHVAIFTTDQLIVNLMQGLASLRESGPLSQSITLITGPSRTGDIELTLSVGVHGPAELHALLLRE